MSLRYGRGFSLIELLVVISIIGLLSSMILVYIQKARNVAFAGRTKSELRNFAIALEMYSIDNNKYPCDVTRNLPSGIERYLSTGTGNWPKAPWPGSVYDWDYWTPTVIDQSCGGRLQTDNNPDHDKPVYQISVRFCDIDGNYCNYPNESWATEFDLYSSAYWCISGPCRAHGSSAYNHPGCCIGGKCPSDQLKCSL